MAESRQVKVKKKCCKSGPRCKRCPVVAKRLVHVGMAEHVGHRLYVIHAPKKVVKAARSR
jgi:hypothetical protein